MLTTLDLSSNDMEDEGALYVSTFLKNNKVIQIISLPFYYSFNTLHIDNH